MGRHSSESQASFYRSFAKWLVPWLAVALLVGIGVWVGVGALGSGPLETQSPASDSEPTESPPPDETPSPTPEPELTPEPSPSVEPEPDETPKTPKPTAPKGNGLTVQVLNGTGVEEANDRIADELETLGYEIINLEGASKAYSSTTVYWSYPEARKAARRLATYYGWEAGPKPENLSTTVALHIIVGADEA
jgi:hypothetical protein